MDNGDLQGKARQSGPWLSDGCESMLLIATLSLGQRMPRFSVLWGRSSYAVEGRGFITLADRWFDSTRLHHSPNKKAGALTKPGFFASQ